MDAYQLFRSVMTILEVLAFGGIIWWAWGSARRSKFDEAAQLPFLEDESMTMPSVTAPSARSAMTSAMTRGRK